MIWGWLTWGAQSASSSEVVTSGTQWVWPADLTGIRTFQPRTRDDVWVEFGHSESDDPATDTRDT